MEPRRRRVYMNIVLSQEAAVLELENAYQKEGIPVWGVVREVRDILLGANLTPLQVQAVLVRAWAQVQTMGRVSPGAEAR